MHTDISERTVSMECDLSLQQVTIDNLSLCVHEIWVSGRSASHELSFKKHNNEGCGFLQVVASLCEAEPCVERRTPLPKINPL